MKRFLHLPGSRGRANSDEGSSSSGVRGRSNSASSADNLLAAQERIFNDRLKHLQALAEIKQDHFDKLTSTINYTKIANLIDLNPVIEAKLNSGTTYEDIVAYYSKPEGKRSANLSPPVFADNRIKEIVQDTKTDKAEKLRLLRVYYVHRFSMMTITDIMQAGYAIGIRNDFATKVTQALPDDNVERRVYDSFYQNRKSVMNVAEQAKKEKEGDVLNKDSLERHAESVNRLESMMLFLGTPEHESACNLSLGLISIEKKLRSAGGPEYKSPLADWIYQQMLFLAENSSSFRDQRRILNEVKEKVAAASIHAGERAYANQVLDELHNKGHIPVDENNLKALDMISQVRSLMLNYIADKETSSKGFTNAIRGVVHADHNSKIRFVTAAIERLNEIAEFIRFGFTTGVAVMAVEGDRVDRLEDVVNIHQLIFLARKKMPTSGLPRELTEAVEMILNPPPPITDDWDLPTEEDALRSVSPTIEISLLHVSDFSKDKIDSTVTMLLGVLSNPGEDPRAQRKQVLENIPAGLYGVLRSKHGSDEGAVPAHEFFEELLVEMDSGPVAKTVESFLTRALFKDFEALAKKALKESNDEFAFEVLEAMLPFGKYDATMRAEIINLMDDFAPELNLDNNINKPAKKILKRLDALTEIMSSSAPAMLPTSEQYRDLVGKQEEKISHKGSLSLNRK